MTVRYLGPQHIGDELHHYYRQATAPTDANLLQVGDLWSDTTANVVKRCTSTSPITFVSIESAVIADGLVKAISIADPEAADNFGGIFFDRAATISQVNHTKLAGTNVVYNIHHATTRNSGAPNKLWTVDKTVTSESGEEFTTFDDATIPAGSYLWWSITSISGVPTRFESSFEYTED